MRPEVLVGPAVGEDASVIRWPEGKLMVFASDPIFLFMDPRIVEVCTS